MQADPEARARRKKAAFHAAEDALEAAREEGLSGLPLLEKQIAAAEAKESYYASVGKDDLAKVAGENLLALRQKEARLGKKIHCRT